MMHFTSSNMDLYVNHWTYLRRPIYGVEIKTTVASLEPIIWVHICIMCTYLN